MSTADVTILCLPDTAAKEAVTIAKSLNCRVIDASSAHRTSKEWIYGLPEISKHHRENIKKAKLVANPGCFATAAILLPRPLILINKISRNDQLSINAVSGYSGGGSGMISKYEPPSTFRSHIYGLTLEHKHLPETMQHSELSTPPIFIPSVGNFYQGMLVSIPLFLKKGWMQIAFAAAERSINKLNDRRYSRLDLVPSDVGPGVRAP